MGGEKLLKGSRFNARQECVVGGRLSQVPGLDKRGRFDSKLSGLVKLHLDSAMTYVMHDLRGINDRLSQVVIATEAGTIMSRTKLSWTPVVALAVSAAFAISGCTAPIGGHSMALTATTAMTF